MKAFIQTLLLLVTFAAIRAEDITTTNGKRYFNVTISRAEPDGLIVMTDAGIEKIPFASLSKALQTKFGYDPQKAAQFKATAQKATAQRQFVTDAANAAAAAQEKAKAADAAQQAADMEKAKDADAALQAASRSVTIKPRRGATSIPGVHVMRVSGEVLQIVPGGVLLGNWQNQTLEPYRDERGTYHGGSIIMDEPLFIGGVPDTLVDGARFSGMIYPAGRYRYTSVTGAEKTVLRYATSPELAIKLQAGK